MATIEWRQKQVDFSKLSEPQLTAQDARDLEHGIFLFNSGRFWESHEAWEEVWKRHADDNRIFFQGLIQVAAGLHQLQRSIYHGTDKHLRNALWKLRPFLPLCLGIDIRHLVDATEKLHQEVRRLGAENIDQIHHSLFPAIQKKE